MKNLSTLAIQTLVQLEAQIVARHLPVREHSGQAPAIHHWRQDTHNGIMARGAGGPAERKQSQRARAELDQAGLIKPGMKVGAVCVTAMGHRLARALAWPHDRDRTVAALRRLKVAMQAKDHIADRFVPEPFVLGVPWGHPSGVPFYHLALNFAPFIADGYIEDRSSVPGQVFYRFKRIPTSVEKLAEKVCGWQCEFNESLADLFWGALDAERDRIISDTQHYADIGPLPVHLSETESGRDFDDLRGLESLYPFLMKQSA